MEGALGDAYGGAVAVAHREQPPVRRILLVDDDERIRSLIRLLLSYEIIGEFDEAADGREALRLILERETCYDAVVLNHLMPQLTGLEVLRLLQRVGVHVPVLFYSAAATPELLLEARAAGACCVLWTPFEPAVMVEAVEAILGRPILS